MARYSRVPGPPVVSGGEPDYWEKKSAGVCVYWKCRKAAGATSLCDEHHAKQRQYERKHQAKEGWKERHAKRQREWRKKMREMGRCGGCGRKAQGGKGKCKEHKAEERARRAFKRFKAGSKRRIHMACGEYGHYSATCPHGAKVPKAIKPVPKREERPAYPPLSHAAYATARIAWEP